MLGWLVAGGGSTMAHAVEEQLPQIALVRAVELAQQHIEKQNVSVADRSLIRAEWARRVSNREAPWCWYMQWANKSEFEFIRRRGTKGGGTLAIFVFSDGRVEHHFER